ncbi:hypothetical protein VOLCADRAFT_103907 [Volvox carteri f. nagariensis]|uniref:Sucrose phosphatase-like domain-containing protein n=1 Tax=Volvox carteri f. nagariensis TaxID=3068 RepID=D8TQ09_VOLCA|nr:uncharacterized protein VOLCADRAFT_103907 [Volvox carteri f. nagariensis]EFJ50453.1 hypothetical protein VOLCADRAFT_103907 [Volvox carteri f. nagariensis]|eukprot:XP_002948578.1 hypothetical protein VOLCADRAFT_103907 [Volvox carteri f. nagariensis]
MSQTARIVFSDIDGTIMHEPKTIDRDAAVLLTPPSASGRQGVISAATLHLVAQLRSRGALFVVITGARLSTLLMRLPYLPAADAYVCENGGRILYPGSDLPTACPITEDAEWRSSHDQVVGSVEQDAVQPKDRTGSLWELYRRLLAEGWYLDANGYTTSFRVHARGDKTMDDLRGLAAFRSEGLSCSFNLGAADFYPATSGKVMAARHLMVRFGVAAKDCCFLCDDDNDLELAREVGRAFLPSISSDSVRQAAEARPEHFVVAKCEGQGVAATEEMLQAVMTHYDLQ